MRHALITGITGQDGSLMARLLLAKGYRVHGLVRRCSSFNTWRIDDLIMDENDPRNRLFLHYGDMADDVSLLRVIEASEPDEIYNFAAQSHVGISFESPIYTAETDAIGTLRLLEAVKRAAPTARVYQASTSELYGNSKPRQNEDTPFRPNSPYAAAKLYAHNIAVNYREAYGMWISCGIAFNHESRVRGANFVTKKIANAAARAACGEAVTLRLGHLNAIRDWGWASEYVEAMWLMLQKETPDDFVLATGKACTVDHFLRQAFESAEVPVDYFPTHELIGNTTDGRVIIKRDEKQFRPLDVPALQGNASKAWKHLGWAAEYHHDDVARMMVQDEIKRIRARGAFPSEVIR